LGIRSIDTCNYEKTKSKKYHRQDSGE